VCSTSNGLKWNNLDDGFSPPVALQFNSPHPCVRVRINTGDKPIDEGTGMGQK